MSKPYFSVMHLFKTAKVFYAWCFCSVTRPVFVVQEDDIFRLLEELDSFEAEFFDLGFKVKEMKKTKDEVIPDLQNELEKARYVNEAGER